MQTHLNTHIMQQITITTHNYIGGADITLGDLLNHYTNNNELYIQEDITWNDMEDVTEENFAFPDAFSLRIFLNQIPSFLTEMLEKSGGDDSYFDYTPALMEQVQEFLQECQKLPLTLTFSGSPSKNRELWEQYCEHEKLYRAIQINIDFFNAMLAHQDPDESHCNDINYYWCSGLQAIPSITK